MRTALRPRLIPLLLPLLLVGCGGEGPPGQPCTVKDNSDGTATITCPDGSKVTITAGKEGQKGTSCSVKDNGDGTKTITCTDGTTVKVADGTPGTPGAPGDPGAPGNPGTPGKSGANGGNVEITNFHGTDRLMQNDFNASGKYFPTLAITSATADPAGLVTVNFTVADANKKPVPGIATVRGAIVKLLPAAGGESFSKWVSYIYRTQTVTGSAMGSWPNPDNTAREQATTDANGKLTDNKDGSYKYVFGTDLTKASMKVNGQPQAISYERNPTHRVAIMIGGSAGPTATAHFDFVPDGSKIAETRNLMKTDTCKGCHGPLFRAHGGDRISVESCVTCHIANTEDPHGGESLDMKVMIHKIHAGQELASMPGPDGKVWDDPATPQNERADNGKYAIWGYNNTKHEWWKAGFPAHIENCVKCHQGNGENVDNWKTKPSRVACGSCHDTVDFKLGTNHKAGPQNDDSQCSTCHPASGRNAAVTEAHDWTKKDIRNIPEFTAELTVTNLPARGYFQAGEAPVLKLVLKDNGTPIDHTTFKEDTSPEGCVSDPCPAADGLFAPAALYVHGPRAKRMPVLTTSSRAKITSPTAGPFDLSAANATLELLVDGGETLYTIDANRRDVAYLGKLSLPVSGGTFVTKSAATTKEIATWLNAHAGFKARAIATVETNNNLTLRSRNLGTRFAIQLLASEVAAKVFNNDLAIKVAGAANNISIRVNPANNDPKAVWSKSEVTYLLDPVDDLVPGTYIASVEIADRGRKSGTDYKTPTVAKTPFKVKQAADEKPPAGNCDTCHQGPTGQGFVLDFARHYKIFDDSAIDQCGSCHDYQPSSLTGEWSGGHPISKRVHAVHVGSALTTPLGTVAYSNGDPLVGRNWDITLPLDARNCEMCHEKGNTSGTWANNPNRLACMGCHDKPAAKAHIRATTFDPTPADPWSGDEGESCKACH